MATARVSLRLEFLNMIHKAPIALTLYTRHGCHLCETMQQQLAQLQIQHGFSLNIVDIDADSYLRMRYDELVPVLAAGETELFHYQLNEAVLLQYLRR